MTTNNVTPQDAIRQMLEAGLSEARISALVEERGHGCSQATIHRIKKGGQRCAWDLGEVILAVRAEVCVQPSGEGEAA